MIRSLVKAKEIGGVILGIRHYKKELMDMRFGASKLPMIAYVISVDAYVVLPVLIGSGFGKVSRLARQCSVIGIFSIDVNAADKNGNTPAHYAAMVGGVSCLDQLVLAGADWTKPNNEGQTPLDVARASIAPLIKAHLESLEFAE